MAINAIWIVVGCLCSPKGAPGCANKVSESSPSKNKAAESSDSCWLFVLSFIFCYNKLYAYIYKLKILTNTNRYV